MLRILIFRTFPSILDPDGYNIQEIGFAKALVRAGAVCDVILYNGSNADSVKEIEVRDNGKIVGTVKVYMRHGIGILKNGFFPGLKDIVKDYDLIQVHEYDQISSWLYYAWSKMPVVIYHGPYMDPFNKGYNFKCSVFDKSFLELKNNKKVLCFTKSGAAADFLSKKGFKNVIPIGVGLDTDNFKNCEESIGKAYSSVIEEISVGLKNGKWNAVYVGKIEPRRNSMMLLDVISKVTEQNKDIHFVVVGSGDNEYLTEWKDKAKSLIEEGNLTYIEKMSQAYLRELYTKAELMVFPSNYDIFGMVLLEAMYFNLPVISSNNGGSDTLIRDGENGIILEDFDADSWTRSILEMHDNKEKYAAIKQKLIDTEHDIYTWDGIAKRYLEEIENRLSIEERVQ